MSAWKQPLIVGALTASMYAACYVSTYYKEGKSGAVDTRKVLRGLAGARIGAPATFKTACVEVALGGGKLSATAYELGGNINDVAEVLERVSVVKRLGVVGLMEAVHLWWTADQASDDVIRFVDCEVDSDLAADYLVNGKLAKADATLDPKPEVVVVDTKTKSTNVVGGSAVKGTQSSAVVTGSEAEKKTTKVVTPKPSSEAVSVEAELNLTRVTVTQHRRINKGQHMKYAACVTSEVRARFGVPKPTEANRLAIRRYALGILQKQGLRPTEIAKIMPYIVSAACVPTRDDLRAATWLSSAESSSRMTQYWKAVGAPKRA